MFMIIFYVFYISSHLFAIGSAAYTSMVTQKENQVIVIR